MFLNVTLATKVQRPSQVWLVRVETNNLCGCSFSLDDKSKQRERSSVQCINDNMLTDFSEIQLWIKKQLYLTWQSLLIKLCDKCRDNWNNLKVFEYSNWNGQMRECVHVCMTWVEMRGHYTLPRFYLICLCGVNLFSIQLIFHCCCSLCSPPLPLLRSCFPSCSLQLLNSTPSTISHFLFVFHPLPIRPFLKKEWARDKEKFNDILPLPDSHPMAVHYQIVRSDCCIMEAFREPRWHWTVVGYDWISLKYYLLDVVRGDVVCDVYSDVETDRLAWSSSLLYKMGSVPLNVVHLWHHGYNAFGNIKYFM